MKRIASTFLSLAIGANYFLVSAQQPDLIKKDTLNPVMRKIAKPESEPNWIKFKDSININPETIFIEFKPAFDLRENDTMLISKIEKDDLGFTHYHYQQYYKNIKIEAGTFTIHTNKNRITYAANGKILTGINIDIIPVLTPKQAIDLSLKYINAKEYMWQSEFWEKNLKERTGNPDATYYPKPELVIREIKNKNTKSYLQDKQYFLVYKLDIYSSSPNYSQRVFIDAKTGEILEIFPLQSN